MRPLRIGIEWGLDRGSLANGMFRYGVDLLGALHALNEDARYVVYGSRAEPPPEAAHLFRDPRWQWRSLPRWDPNGSWLSQRIVLNAAPPLRYAVDRIDLLHVLDTWVPRFVPCPIVLTIHDLLPEVMPEHHPGWRSTAGWRAFRAAAQKRVARAIAISQATAEDVVKVWGLAPERLSVVHHGTTFPPRGFASVKPGERVARFGLDASPFVCAPLALHPRKNLDALLDAMTMVHEERPELRLALFGGGDPGSERRAWFDRRVEELGLARVVVLVGMVDDLTLADLYRSSVAFVLPSLLEGFGLPLLEAMSVSSCVVARSASSMAEVVGDAGVLVETRDPRAIAVALLSLARDPSRGRTLRERARARAAGFTLERMARATFEVYRRTAGRDPG